MLKTSEAINPRVGNRHSIKGALSLFLDSLPIGVATEFPGLLNDTTNPEAPNIVSDAAIQVNISQMKPKLGYHAARQTINGKIYFTRKGEAIAAPIMGKTPASTLPLNGANTPIIQTGDLPDYRKIYLELVAIETQVTLLNCDPMELSAIVTALFELRKSFNIPKEAIMDEANALVAKLKNNNKCSPEELEMAAYVRAHNGTYAQYDSRYKAFRKAFPNSKITFHFDDMK